LTRDLKVEGLLSYTAVANNYSCVRATITTGDAPVYQVASANTYTKIKFDGESYDTLSEYSPTDSTFTATFTGKYLIQSNIYSVSESTDTESLCIYVNGVKHSQDVKYRRTPDAMTGSSTDDSISISDIIQLNAGDYVGIYYNPGRFAAALIYGYNTSSLPRSWFTITRLQ
jgi:hypothetical protein